MRCTFDPPCRIPPPGGQAPGTFIPHLHATLWLRIGVWEERVSGHLHLAATEEAARRGEPWRVIDVAGHPFEPVPAGPGLPPDAGELLEKALAHLTLRFYRSTALGAVSRLGEPLAAFRSRVLASLRPEIQHRVAAGNHGGPRGELPAAVSRIGGGFEELAVQVHPGDIRRASLGVVLVPAGLELRGPALWDDMVRGPVREGRSR